jgi:hypothetical protein
MKSFLPPVSLPEAIPQTLPPQRFQLGELVYWYQVPDPDFGRIVGVFYTQSASCTVTGLHYLIHLDEDSPSRSITNFDFAFSEDIQPLDDQTILQSRKHDG